MPRKFGQPRLNKQNTQRRTLESERLEVLKEAAGRGRAAQFLRTQWEHSPVTPSWSVFQGLAEEISSWALDTEQSGHEKIQFALTRQRYENRIAKLEAAAYAKGYKTNPNSKIAGKFTPLIESSGSKLVTHSVATRAKGYELGWTGYSDADRDRMLQLRPGSDKDVDWNAFYFASTRAQAEGYGDNISRVVLAETTEVHTLRINDLFFASNLTGEYKASKLKKELAMSDTQTLMPGLGKRSSLCIVVGLEGLDSESETENIVAWEHAQAHLELDEV